MNRRRNFVLLAILAAAATADLGHAAAPGASIPDFSGMWAHPYIPGVEPLASGPTSITNRARRNGVGNTLRLVGDYSNPILKPEAAEVVKKFGELSLRGVGYPTPRNQCWPNGCPWFCRPPA